MSKYENRKDIQTTASNSNKINGIIIINIIITIIIIITTTITEAKPEKLNLLKSRTIAAVVVVVAEGHRELAMTK